tara:strand:- start:616 stop:1356 length:741 start_codon:yes stop_codon:yes gene_type:complete
MNKTHTQYIKKIYRIIGEKLAPHFRKVGISANQITLSRIFFVLIGSILILNDDFLSKFLTLLFLLIFSLFDAADGSLARITKKSLFGMWMDTVIDRLGLLIIFTFFAIKLSFLYDQTISIIIINFLILILYLIKFSFLSDISVKQKYSQFRETDSSLGVLDNTKEEDQSEKYTFDFLKENLNIKNIFEFLHHQFSPHTANLILYMGLINLFDLFAIGLISIFVFYVIWIIRDIYKITIISINIDKN